VNCGQTTASRATFLGCRAVQEAARKLKAELNGGSLEALGSRTYYGEIVIDDTVSLESKSARPKTHFAYGFATQVVLLDDDGRINKVVAAHDVGRVMNPILLEGQLEGSVHMGLGFALTEEYKVEQGVPQNLTVNSLGLVRARNMPEVEVILIEERHPDGPYGAKGIAEIGLVPTAGAVAGALYSYDHIRRFSLPMKDSPAARYIRGLRA
jgi:xanthine dehydrogenase molybdenum-binding subunit